MDNLSAYIEKARAMKKTDEEIKIALVQAGWQETMVMTALSPKHDDPLPPPPPPDQTQKSPGNAWDAFEHALLFISLYVMATSVGLVLHYFVDKWFPAPTTTDSQYSYTYYYDSSQVTMFRGYLAALIVSTPLFIYFFLDVSKRTLANPIIRSLRARRVLTYLTLIATFVIMMADVISAVFNFLNGDVTVNFLFHLLVTFLISIIIFVYYLGEVKEDRKMHA